MSECFWFLDLYYEFIMLELEEILVILYVVNLLFSRKKIGLKWLKDLFKIIELVI